MTSSIFVPGPICTRNSLNRAKSNYDFHWKLKIDRAFIDLDNLVAIFYFRHLQGKKLWSKLDQKLKLWVRPVSAKIWVFQSALNCICITMRTTCGQSISSIWRSLLEVLPPNPQKLPQFGPEPKNIVVSLGKVVNDLPTYPEAETWHLDKWLNWWIYDGF